MFSSDRKLSWLVLTVAAIFALAVSALADSNVRIVRLSNVEGDVRIDRNAGQGLERAFLNLPVIQGARIQTRAQGRTEVEFEDGSVLRIAPNTIVDFPQLSLLDSGTKATTIHVQEGTAYLKVAGEKSDEFTINFARETVTLPHAAHLRVSIGDTDAELAVFKGDAHIEGASGSVDVGKSQSVDFDLADKDHFKVAKDIEPGPYDAWDEQQDQYQQRYAANNSYNSPNAYGASDLNYYGAYSNVPGYGTLWQPYFTGAGWDPFMNGAWAYYPGFGYNWVSGYPWGWAPYYSGNWVYVPTYGWGWQPGGSWAGLGSFPRVSRPPSGFHFPQQPGGGHGTILLSRGPVSNPVGNSNRLQILDNSAGQGIPRGSIKNLSEIAQSVQKTGVTTTKIHVEPMQSAGAWRGYGSPWAGGGGYSHAGMGMGGARSSGGSSGGHSSGGHVGR